ncbi:hypothetical protein AAVH_33075 [Aphelenchoides avenae]|nr:hypothetical protein AAVH_33075 [Aphelenchus avenae]
MKSLPLVLAVVGCAASVTFEHRRKDGNDIASWCGQASTAHFVIDQATFGNVTWNTAGLGMGLFDRSLPSIAQFNQVKLDRFMKTINASKSWTTGIYTVDCANAASFPELQVYTDMLGVLTFTPSDYVDLKNARVGQCEVLLLPAPLSELWIFGNHTLQKYCDPNSF